MINKNCQSQKEEPVPKSSSIGGQKPSNITERRKAGTYLKQCRELAGLTQRELANACGFDYYTFVSQLEGGHGKLPAEHWEKYSKTVGVDTKKFAQRLLGLYEPIVSKLLND